LSCSWQHSERGADLCQRGHPAANQIFARAAQNRMMHHEDPSTAIHDSLGRILPRRAQVIDTATLRGLLSP
jgi:hypothetical protein